VFFKKLFAKKNDGFYLQVEDDKTTPEQEPKAKAKAEPVTVTAPAEVASTTATPAVTETKADKKASKKSAKKAEAPKAVEAAAPVPAPVVTATTFAPDYLIKPSSISRRRMPGANMNGFLDMARQAKKPVNIK
jgi:hypothetical protein